MGKSYVNVHSAIGVDAAILWQTMVIGILVVTADIRSLRKKVINNTLFFNISLNGIAETLKFRVLIMH
jgi:hypothetical protein